MEGFLTGSHAYGTPREDSDIDLVVFVPAPDCDTFRSLCADEIRISNEGSYPNGCAYRFGKLNLLVFSSELHFQAWKDATADLVARRPVTREEAVKTIDATVEAAEKAAIANPAIPSLPELQTA